MDNFAPYREGRLILPVPADGSLNAVNRELRRELAQRFGGYTMTTGQGGWVSPTGELVEEPVAIYDVAIRDGAVERDDLWQLAHVYRGKAKQEAVYLRFPDGRVFLVDKASPWQVPANEGLRDWPIGQPSVALDIGQV